MHLVHDRGPVQLSAIEVTILCSVTSEKDLAKLAEGKGRFKRAHWSSKANALVLLHRLRGLGIDIDAAIQQAHEMDAEGDD